MPTVRQMKATSRAGAGRGAARAERRAGRVPGVIYGDGKPPMHVSVDHAELKQRIYAGRFLTTIYELEIDGSKQRVIPRDFQLDAVKDLPIHVDFMRLGEGAHIRVRIPVHVKNADQSPGVKRGGTVNIVTHSVEVMCDADAIPEEIEVDISGLEINSTRLPCHPACASSAGLIRRW
jgi:large subunit ribosomal protein L25